MIIDDLVSNMKKIMEHVSFEKRSGFDTLNDPKIWRLDTTHSFVNNTQTIIILDNQSAYYFYRFINTIRQYCDKKNLYFSEEFLDKLMIELIGKFHNEDIQKETPRLITEFLKQFEKTNYEKYHVFLPISHYDFQKEIELENFKIKELTAEEFFEYVNRSKDITKMEYDSLTKHNETKIIAIIEVESIEEDDALQKAKNMLKKFIHSEKLFDVGSFVTMRTGHYNQISESIIIHNKTTGNLSSKHHNYFIPTRITPQKEFYKNLEPHRDKLYKFLFSDHTTSFQQSIISSMHWLGEVDNLRDTNEKKYISYLTGLEKLSIKKYEQAKKKKFAEHISVFQNTPKEIKFYEEYYERRNLLLHDEHLRIFNEQEFTLLSILRSLLLEMIDHYDEFENIEQFWLKQYNVTL